MIENLILLAGGIAILFAAIGGYKYMNGSVSDDKEAGKKTIGYALAGCAIVLLAWTTVSFAQIWSASGDEDMSIFTEEDEGENYEAAPAESNFEKEALEDQASDFREEGEVSEDQESNSEEIEPLEIEAISKIKDLVKISTDSIEEDESIDIKLLKTAFIKPPEPTSINIGSSVSSGFNNNVKFCGLNKNNEGKFGTAICEGAWKVNPCGWTSSCSTGWENAVIGDCAPDCKTEKTCSDLGGDICSPYEICSGSWLDVSDSNNCCDEECEDPPLIYLDTKKSAFSKNKNAVSSSCSSGDCGSSTSSSSYTITELAELSNYIWYLEVEGSRMYSGSYDSDDSTEQVVYYSDDPFTTWNKFSISGSKGDESTRVYKPNGNLYFVTEGGLILNKDRTQIYDAGQHFLMAAGSLNGKDIFAHVPKDKWEGSGSWGTQLIQCTQSSCSKLDFVNDIFAFDIYEYKNKLIIAGTVKSYRNGALYFEYDPSSGSAKEIHSESPGFGSTMEEHDGMLYVGQARPAKVFTYDGQNFVLEKEFGDDLDMGDFEVFNGDLYAAFAKQGGNGEIWRKSGTEQWEQILSQTDLAGYGVDGDLAGNTAGFFTQTNGKLYVSFNSPTGERNGPGYILEINTGGGVTGITCDWSTHIQKASGSDNWPITWADDDNQYTAWGDGWGFSESGSKKSLGVSKVDGSSASSFTGTELKTWSADGADNRIGKSYGILSVAGTLYMWIGYGGDGSGLEAWKSSKVYKSTDHGKKWTSASWNFTKDSDKITNLTFMQFGKNYGKATDNYVYIYAPYLGDVDWSSSGYGDYPATPKPGKIILMRVPKDKIMTESSYEFFAGLDTDDEPSWESDSSKRKPVIENSKGVGWTMSAIYYPDIDRYILMTEHTGTHAGNLAIYSASKPWGPWTVVKENTNWGNSSLGSSTAFFWNISPKWISGKNFTLVFTGSGSYDYWNTVDCTVEVGSSSSSSSSSSGGGSCCCCGSGSSSGGSSSGGSSSGGSGSIKSITWDCDSLKHQAKGSDGWTMTWADDDNQYTAWGDGQGFSESGSKKSLGVSKVSGASASSFTGTDIWTGYGKGAIFSVSGTLYMWVCEGDKGNEKNWSGWECAKHSRLYKSTNKGKNWSKASWNFTRTDNGILTPSFLQAGKDYGEAKDDYVYSYSIDDKYGNSYTLPNPGKVDLMRVPKDKIMTESSYEFFAGLDTNDEPSWTTDVSQKTPVLTNSTEGIGWTVSVIYYPAINRYILITEHTISHGGNLIFYDAPNPWGPWTIIEKNTSWCGFDTVFGGSIVPKWISGNDFTFVFSGPGTYDRWNTVTGTIELYSPSIIAANFDANWVFAPVEFNSNLFLPVSDNQGNEANCCTYVKKSDGTNWTTDLTMGVGTEDIAKLIVYKSKLYAITESNDGIYYRDTSGTWIKTKDFAGKEEGEYGAFDAAILNNKLYTGVSGYYSSDNLNIFEHNGSTWTIIKTFQASGERPTAWGMGADSSNLYVGIAGFGRGTSGSTSFDGIWKYDGSTSWTQESAVKAQCFENAFGTMFAGGQGKIYKRSSEGSWSEVYDTGSKFVLSLKLVGSTLYAGTEDDPCVYKTSDGSSWSKVECFGSGDGPAYVGEYQGGLVVSYYENGKAYIK